MKKLSLLAAFAFVALSIVSCNKVDYKSFVGVWGVERIEYESYNTDYAGHPIQGSMITSEYDFDPYDIDNGIQLVFFENKTGEMRNNNVDTVWYDWNPDSLNYESYIVNPDTTLVTPFTYSFDNDESILYMNMPNSKTYMMRISNLTDDSFVYLNNYGQDADNRLYFEKAYMKRISSTPAKSSTRRNKVVMPHMPGSFLGGFH